MRALPLALFGVLVGWGIGFWAAPQVLAGLAGSSLARVNYRKREVVAGLGLLLALGLLVWAAPLAVAARVDPLRAARAGLLAPSGLAVVVAGLAFLLLGLADDLIEDQGGNRGFRGHLRALASGRWSAPCSWPARCGWCGRPRSSCWPSSWPPSGSRSPG